MEQSHQVMEMPGLYGPYACPERVLQKIWLQGDFDRSRATTADGQRVEILSPGKWNRLGGPDFLGARLRMGDRSVTGDVEVHFYAKDWAAHGHPNDPAYRNVVLHVVLFPPAVGGQIVAIPTLVLMPLLLRDLEEYTADDAIETITARDEWRQVEALAGRSAGDLRAMLMSQAEARWRQKVQFAHMRIARIGWEGAAHHTALEILGYRFNRAPMLALAARHPLADWAGGRLDSHALLADEGLRWQLQGVRPANHPRARLKQYRDWAMARPDWPARLLAVASSLPGPSDAGAEASTKTARGALRLPRLRQQLAAEILAETVGGSRLDNLFCDGFLPLLAAQTGRNFFALWFHWFTGDIPAQMRRSLATLGQTGREQPFCHGLAQGLLGWLLRQEIFASG